MIVTFSVPGNPVGKGRPRATSRGGFTRMYTPKKTADYEKRVQMAYFLAAGRAKIESGPVSVILDIYCQCPKATSQKKRAEMPIPRDKKPDIDNVEKCVLDGLNGHAWRDDGQVAQVLKRKFTDEEGRVDVVIVKTRSVAWLIVERVVARAIDVLKRLGRRKP